MICFDRVRKFMIIKTSRAFAEIREANLREREKMYAHDI